MCYAKLFLRIRGQGSGRNLQGDRQSFRMECEKSTRSTLTFLSNSIPLTLEPGPLPLKDKGLSVPNGAKISRFEAYLAAQHSFVLHFHRRFASWRARLRRAVAYLSAILVCPLVVMDGIKDCLSPCCYGAQAERWIEQNSLTNNYRSFFVSHFYLKRQMAEVSLTLPAASKAMPSARRRSRLRSI